MSGHHAPGPVLALSGPIDEAIQIVRELGLGALEEVAIDVHCDADLGVSHPRPTAAKSSGARSSSRDAASSW